jgi:beta-glucosidase
MRPRLGLLAALAISVVACERSVSFSAADIAAHHMLARAPRGFFLGAATSAYQIEGGARTDWTDWEKGSYADGTPHVANGASAAVAADSWNKWRLDVAACKSIGANMYRLGVEWSRLEPTEGAWDIKSVARYREMFAALRASGIEPMVTLSHFTLPPWIAARGGWDWEGTPAALAAFAGRAGAAFGDLVDWWITLNEPNVYVAKGYLAGQWPPGAKDPARAVRALAAFERAHGLMTQALRAADRVDADGDGHATRIGIAHNVRVFDARTWNPVDHVAADMADDFYNEQFLDAVAHGRVHAKLPRVLEIDEPFPALAGSFDFLGLNYYTRELTVGHLLGDKHYEPTTAPGRPLSDLGWEIYPEGLYRVLKRYAARPWPLFITENGVADAHGDLRPDYLRAHLVAVDRAMSEGVNVLGYLHWSLIDNFEWSHGYDGRFGLFTIDFAHDPTLARHATPAVDTFREAARALGTLRP